MKVRVQQLNPIIGDLSGNKALIKSAIQQAGQDKVDLLVLPELVTCGYLPLDLLERPDFREANYRINEDIIEYTGETTVIFGGITGNEATLGRPCFNSALVARQGQKMAEIHKTLLPTYDVYDELRYFEPNNEFKLVTISGVQLGLTICEDIWHNFHGGDGIQYHRYKINPAEKLVDLGAQAIVNLSASPFTKTKFEERRQMLGNQVEMLGVPVFYANQAGANTELISDGDSMVLDPEGEIIASASLFHEDKIDVEWKVEEEVIIPLNSSPRTVPGQTERMFQALVKGLQDYLAKTKISDKVVLGLSGGIDSALVACIAVEALGADQVLGVTMPSNFSSEGSVADSEKLAQNLGISFKKLSVSELYKEYSKVLKPIFKGTDFGVAEENLQSRIRGVLLMAISNKFGHMLLNTGNKSELATGYCTLYGDMAGGLGIISDLYKQEVYAMSRWLNESYYGEEVIPASILEKPPSAELRPDQQDADTLPDYEILDPILEAYLDQQRSPEQIIAQGFDAETVRFILALVDRNEYKRFQAVPGLKVSGKAFGSGRRIPLVQGWTSE